MRYRKLDQNGDYSFGQGQSDFYRDVPEAVAQAVATRLRLWSGEWFLNTAEGTPWVQSVLGHNRRTAEPAIRQRILGTQGVTGLTYFEALYDETTRTMTVNATIDTAYGPATITEVL